MKGVLKFAHCLCYLCLLIWKGAAEAPINGSDSFESRPFLSPGGVYDLDLFGATYQDAEGPISLFESGFTRWWKIRAPATGVLLIRILPGSYFKPTMTLKRGEDLPHLRTLTSNEGQCESMRFDILAADVNANEVISAR